MKFILILKIIRNIGLIDKIPTYTSNNIRNINNGKDLSNKNVWKNAEIINY